MRETHGQSDQARRAACAPRPFYHMSTKATESVSGARVSIRVTTLLSVLGGNKAGCRKLPFQFMCGVAVPIRPTEVVRAFDVRKSRPFSWCGVG